MSVPTAAPHVQAVLAALEAALPDSYAVCDEQGPRDPLASVPYVVVFAEPGDMSPGPFNANRDLLMLLPIRSVGLTPEQARAGSDRVRAVMLGGNVTVDGRGVTITQDAGSSTSDRDDSLSTPLFWDLVVYRLRSTG